MATIFEKEGRIWHLDERGKLISDGVSGLNRQLDRASFRRLINEVIRYLEGKRPSSVRSMIGRILNPIHDALELNPQRQLPQTSGAWQAFIRDIYQASLANEGAELETTEHTWNGTTRPFLRSCLRNGLIPPDVIVPRMKGVKQAVRGGSEKNDFLTERTSGSPKNPEAYLVSLNLARTDVEYLEALQFDTEAHFERLEAAAVEHFKLIVAHWECGKRIIETTDVDALTEVYVKPPCRRVTATLIAEEIALSSTTNNGVYSRTHRHPLIVTRDKSDRQYAHLLNGMTGVIADHIPNPVRINWMLGNLTITDVAIAILQLLNANPKWRPESLLYADLYNKDGATYLKLNDRGTEFSIFKERAKSKKTSTLEASSQFILDTVVRMTDSPRRALKTGKLFLATAQQRKIGNPHKGMLYRVMSGNVKRSVVSFLRLGHAYGRDGLTFSKVKNSRALVEFLRTGSVRAVARLLGNGEKTALKYYIPPSIIGLWNTRQARRMQNLTIAAATAGKPYQLAATDFKSPKDLAKFTKDVLDSAGYTANPLLKRLRTICTEHGATDIKGTMLVSISQESLAAIYSAQLCLTQSGSTFESIASGNPALSGLLTLAQYLKSLLPDHKNPDFRKAHKKASQSSGTLARKLKAGDLALTINGKNR